MKLSFHGGVGEVTGACYLLESERARVLIDCGFFQGCRECEDLNFQNFGFEPSLVRALVVTHAHLDHIGRIPCLVRAGFRGTIYSTAATRDLARLILEDALAIAKREHERGSTLLYEEEDIKRAFTQWKALRYHEEERVGDVSFMLYNAGHILGSSMVRVQTKNTSLLFSGDVGNVPSVLLPPPDILEGIEYLIVESAYGNKIHEPAEERTFLLERAVEDVAMRKGTLLIPAFATERTQDILYVLNQLMHFRRVPDMPVFVDAPLAIRVTEIYEKYMGLYRDEIKQLFTTHPNLFRFKRLHMTASVEESKRINDVASPKVIVAGSGMMNGGRILHHARRYLPDPKSILLIIGYQSTGSLGRDLVNGERMVQIFREQIAVEAEIRKIGGFSAHADNPQLYAFVEHMRDTLTRVFVVQGEQVAAMHFSQEIRDRLGIAADVPTLHDEVVL
ncbi:MAG: metallo-beta-lactamase family protein [Parcubacteria group bacterium Gr01-1014_66]|nr:MAG: metallo-beta-lactamase family protein [Parcubacteria group bacterium Gr01-1014_66]